MKEVKCDKLDLLAIIQKNRDTHIAEYIEACQGYRKQALAKIEEVLDRLKRQVSVLKEGEAIELANINFSLPAPIDHREDYDRVIRMLEMSVEKVVSIDHRTFSQYVMDEWSWKDAWNDTKAFYSRG